MTSLVGWLNVEACLDLDCITFFRRDVESLYFALYRGAVGLMDISERSYDEACPHPGVSIFSTLFKAMHNLHESSCDVS